MGLGRPRQAAACRRQLVHGYDPPAAVTGRAPDLSSTSAMRRRRELGSSRSRCPDSRLGVEEWRMRLVAAQRHIRAGFCSSEQMSTDWMTTITPPRPPRSGLVHARFSPFFPSIHLSTPTALILFTPRDPLSLFPFLTLSKKPIFACLTFDLLTAATVVAKDIVITVELYTIYNASAVFRPQRVIIAVLGDT
ncbi:hypothetical protein EW146_g6599 [Bondarzewia mesenterica]|uniref:Uncharacterized protein n=1 Tax=Bondarzewia mesenterica TaxID=1095465 RepID=A0A4S4LPZ7_9AGAM|nr:hypothetical protein EW146_g6599 [Bondarzewia mesenterica]